MRGLELELKLDWRQCGRVGVRVGDRVGVGVRLESVQCSVRVSEVCSPPPATVWTDGLKQL